MKINLDGRSFVSKSNSENGEVSEATIFQYSQENDMIWAHYEGGSILKGFLVGYQKESSFFFNYQHINKKKELMTGYCESAAKINEDGILELHEQWQWTCKDYSKGTSVLIEKKDNA